MFHLVRNKELEITMDTSGVDDHIPSIAFDIHVALNKLYQSANIISKECWFSCEAIDTFQNQLYDLHHVTSGKVALIDLSENSIFEVTKVDSTLKILINFQDTGGVGGIHLTSSLQPTEAIEIYDCLTKFEKWW